MIFNSLLFFLLFEPMQTSYSAFVSLIPEQSIVAPSLATPGPIKKDDSIGPVIEAKSVYAVDVKTGTPLFVRDIFSRRKIASIEKLVAAMVILDHHSLDETVVVSKNAASQGGSTMGLRPGEEISVMNALTGMLVNSGNDAAVALAEFDAGNEKNFVEKLNEKAFLLNLQDTHFSNAKGFDEDYNYSTAYDTLLFSRAALDYPFIRKTVNIKTTDVTDSNGKIKHHLESTNELLDNSYVNVVGLKTGSTPASGESFVSLAITSDNHEILTVMLDSPNRFKETKILLDWIMSHFIF